MAYDRFGIDSESSTRKQNPSPFAANHRSGFYHEQSFEGEMTPEEVFNMFFGGSQCKLCLYSRLNDSFFC
jgi:hypothetical protein